jgi:hypothetical protein
MTFVKNTFSKKGEQSCSPFPVDYFLTGSGLGRTLAALTL